MTERPINMKAHEVRALLAGTKTQHRVVVKARHENGVITGAAAAPGHAIEAFGGGAWNMPSRIECNPCPYGQTGDRLWVREAFEKIEGQTQPWIETDYRATYTHGDRLGDHIGVKKRWTTASRMPRAASRITLEITEVRVERLREISDADCRAEGYAGGHGSIPGCPYSSTPREHFRWVCDVEGDGPGSLDANPWVWVIRFKQVGDKHGS